MKRGWIFLAAALAFAACEEDSTSPPGKTAAQLTEEGWAQFEGGDLAAASALFAAAIAADAAYLPAYVGDGWSRFGFSVEPEAMLVALQRFDRAIQGAPELADAHAGRAAVLLALGGDSLSAAIEAARTTGEVAPEYVFTHRTSFDRLDLDLIEAFGLAGLARFEEALAVADEIQPSGIIPRDYWTWKVDGVTFPTLAEAVLAYLAKLSASLSG